MSICLPAHKDCQECRGKGQTFKRNGDTKACETCYERNLRAWLKPQMPAIRAAFNKAAMETPYARLIIDDAEGSHS